MSSPSSRWAKSPEPAESPPAPEVSRDEHCTPAERSRVQSLVGVRSVLEGEALCLGLDRAGPGKIEHLDQLRAGAPDRGTNARPAGERVDAGRDDSWAEAD